mgnify:CR=1 FL=1
MIQPMSLFPLQMQQFKVPFVKQLPIPIKSIYQLTHKVVYKLLSIVLRMQAVLLLISCRQQYSLLASMSAHL